MVDALATYQVGDEVNGHVLTSWHEWISVEDAVELVAAQGYRAGVALVGERFVQSHQQLIAGAWHAARRAHDRAVAAAAAQLAADPLPDAVSELPVDDAVSAPAQDAEVETRLARIEALLERIADRVAPPSMPAPRPSSAPAPAPGEQVVGLASPT